MSKSKGIIFVLLGASSYGFTPTFAKLGFSWGYSLGQINISQMIIAALFLWGIFFIKRPDTKNVNKKAVFKLLLSGTFIGLTSIFYYGSMKYLPASLAIILLFQFVWIGIVFEWIYTKERPSLSTLFSILFTIIGVFFASNILNGSIQELPLVGFIFGILSAFTYAGFIFVSGKVATAVSPWLRTPLMVTGSMLLVLVLFMSDIKNVQPTDGKLLIVAAGVALFGAIIPPLFFAIGVPKISGGLANILSSVELPAAIIAANIFLSESVTLVQWIGIFFILFAIVMNEYGTILKQKKYYKTDN